ncbi:hypothetical protein [Fimbriimonas ginsengisoli]|uniref:Uncharacterized protein n=1 Tax=Fimbriimonas ginsengisoli Gsoil 348 TaxID=661478 RepID=A0A068NWA4_FIMGI|nr:hypothetical protein [Fimbriimonas ginsengisoli]AIE87731.1 hypothetical protein OP10G_4363 [Fimbriimonas ginsengisoli Gsoil 348]
MLLSSLLFLPGCSGKPAPDAYMTTSPVGLWVGARDSGTSVDIQEGGYFKLTRAGREILGAWKPSSPGKLGVTLDGQTYEMAFERRDLSLKLTLPGDSHPTQFGQM